MKKNRANLLLFLVAIIWGGGFIFVEILLDAGMSAGLISAARGGIFAVCAFIIFFKKIIRMNRHDVKVGLIAGVSNAAGFLLQTIGQSLTSPSRTALITITYVVFVPIFCWIFWRDRPGLKTAIAVIMCVLGAFLVVYDFKTGLDGGELLGDVLVLLGAAMFGLNIAYLGKSGQKTHYGVISFFLGVWLFIISLAYTLIAKEFVFPKQNVPVCIVSLLYLGVLSSALCQILQVVCQRYTSAESASMILILEGFFGGVLAVCFGDDLTVGLILGGIIILLAVFIQECDVKGLMKKIKKKKNKE